MCDPMIIGNLVHETIILLLLDSNAEPTLKLLSFYTLIKLESSLKLLIFFIQNNVFGLTHCYFLLYRTMFLVYSLCICPHRRNRRKSLSFSLYTTAKGKNIGPLRRPCRPYLRVLPILKNILIFHIAYAQKGRKIYSLYKTTRGYLHSNNG